MNDEELEVLEGLSHGLRKIANAITPCEAASGRDETGGTVDSLTEAVMGTTAGLCRIAAAIEDLAAAANNIAEVIANQQSETAPSGADPKPGPG